MVTSCGEDEATDDPELLERHTQDTRGDRPIQPMQNEVEGVNDTFVYTFPARSVTSLRMLSN